MKQTIKSPFAKIYKKDLELISKESRSQMFFKLGVLKGFAIFIGKNLCWSTLFNKVASLSVGGVNG